MNRRSTLTSLLFLPLVATQQAAAQSTNQLTHKELRDLMMTAKTKADHQKIANHYKAEADHLLAEAKEHEEMADLYQKNPPLLSAKNPLAIGEKHCRGIAERLRQAAVQTKALSAMHDQVAAKTN